MEGNRIPCRSLSVFCSVFILLNCASLGTQHKDTSGSQFSNYEHKKSKHALSPEDKWKHFEIYYSLNDAWEIINKPQFTGQSVIKKIRAMWDSKKPRKIVHKKPRKKRKNVTTTTSSPTSGEVLTTTLQYETTTRARLPGRQNPFVLIEGTLTNSRRNLTRGLLKHTSFVYIRNFRQTPFKYREKFGFPGLLQLKRAFVTLQMYITGRDIERLLEDRPVIMSGYWMRQAAEMIARRYKDLSKLPPVGSDCYKWPADLVKPDVVYFLHTPRTNHNEETNKRIDRIVEIYQRMDPPVIVLDDSTYSPLTDKKIADLRKSMIDKLRVKYPHANEFIKYKLPSDKKHFKHNKTARAHKQATNVTMVESETVKNVTSNEAS